MNTTGAGFIHMPEVIGEACVHGFRARRLWWRHGMTLLSVRDFVQSPRGEREGAAPFPSLSRIAGEGGTHRGVSRKPAGLTRGDGRVRGSTAAYVSPGIP